MMGTDAAQRRANGTGRRRLETRIGVGFLTLVGIVVCMVILAMLRRPPQKVAADVPLLTGAVSPRDVPRARAAIRGRGTVAPKVRLEIMSEVAGRVVFVHSQLRAGGVIPANERILQIDPRGYELAVRRARAVVEEAEVRLDLEPAATNMDGRHGAPFDAERQADLSLVLHGPRVRQAEAALEVAKADLAAAELQLARTSLALPYDVLIAGETVGLGQYVEAGRSLAVAYGTEAFEIELPLGVEDLGRFGALRKIGVPGRGCEAPLTASIEAMVAGGEWRWPGEVVGVIGRVEGGSGRVSLIVEAPRPVEASGDRPPLLPGMVVEVVVPSAPAAGAGEGEMQGEAITDLD